MFAPRMRRVILGTIAGVLVGVLVVGVLAAVIGTWTVVGAMRETQTTNTGTLKNSEDTLARITDCTTPGRPCYDDGQKQTGRVVGSLNRVTIASSSYAAACAARGLTDADAIYECVLAEFDKREPNPLKP